MDFTYCMTFLMSLNDADEIQSCMKMAKATSMEDFIKKAIGHDFKKRGRTETEDHPNFFCDAEYVSKKDVDQQTSLYYQLFLKFPGELGIVVHEICSAQVCPPDGPLKDRRMVWFKTVIDDYVVEFKRGLTPPPNLVKYRQENTFH